MTETKGIMSDEELKAKMFNRDRDAFDDHAAAVAAFCIVHNIELEKGCEIAMDILGDELMELLKSGIYNEAVKNLEKTKHECELELADLQAKMREAADE